MTPHRGRLQLGGTDHPDTGLYVYYDDAVLDAERRAALTRYRHRVQFEQESHLWRVTQQTKKVNPPR